MVKLVQLLQFETKSKHVNKTYTPMLNRLQVIVTSKLKTKRKGKNGHYWMITDLADYEFLEAYKFKQFNDRLIIETLKGNTFIFKVIAW